MTVARGQPALPADVSLAAGSNRRPGAPSICVRRIGATGLKNREACGWHRRVKVDAFLDEVCYDTRKLIVRHVIRPTDMSILDEPKIDCHVHVIDPVNFPYRQDVAYKPAGQEIGSTAQFRHVMDCYNVKHALLVQPNSGYGSDNSCMLDAIETGEGRFKGVAIIDLDADIATLKRYKARGIIGAAINPTFHGNHHYRHASGLMRRLADLDMYFNLQVENEQFLMYAPWIEEIPVKVLIDHLGRPTPPAGLNQPAFAAILRLAETGRVSVKLSGYLKFARSSYPFEDCWPYVRALVDAFTLDHCVWSSDWPYLRARERQDYGPLVHLAGRLFPDAAYRRKLFWDTPNRLFKFADH